MSSKSFLIIQDFIKEVFECDFLSDTLDSRIAQISELMKARCAILQIMKNRPKVFGKEFMEYVFPILEVALQWNELKSSCRLSSEIIKKCNERMTTEASSNFLGVIFEIDIAARCLLSDWESKFVENYTSKNKQIDFLITKHNGEKIGLECTSMRATEELNIVKINETINEKNKKFDQKHLALLPTKLDRKVVIIDITRKDYTTPAIIENMDNVKIGNNLDGVVLTWRENLGEGEMYDLRVKYRSFGNINEGYFTTTWAAMFCPPTRERGPVFFLRKYTEPEPQHGTWGSEEKCPN